MYMVCGHHLHPEAHLFRSVRMTVTLYSVLLARVVTSAVVSSVIFAMGAHFSNTTVSALELTYS